MKDFNYPPSVQVDLFGYLKPQQQESIKPILRIIKRPYQEELCTALLDYLEGHGLTPLREPLLDQMQKSIIKICELAPLSSRV